MQFSACRTKRVRRCASQTPLDLSLNMVRLSDEASGCSFCQWRNIHVSAPAAVPVGALRAQVPPNDPPMLPLCNPGVARVRSSSFYRWSSAWKWGPGRPKRSRFHLDLRMRHPLSRFYTWVMVRTNAGAWGLADNSCLFRTCANFPDLTRGVGAGPLLALGRRHSGAPAYQNW